MDHKIKDRVVPIRPELTRDLTNYIEKSFDMAQQGGDVANELWSPELRAFLDAQTLKSLFFSEDWVFIIVDLIANKISSQPLQIVRDNPDDEDDGLEVVLDNPLAQLLEQPNQWQDYSAWMYNTCVELFLMGNAVMWHAPRAGQLITLPTENITLAFNNKGAVDSYMVSSVRDDGSGLRELEASQSFKADDIIHVRRPNPSSLLWGLSPFIPGRKSILFNRYSTDYLNAFYQKQATPGLALSLDRSVNEDVALRQLRSFEVAYQGRKNTRRTLILPKGVTATTLTHSLADQKLIDHIETNRETICGLLKVPKHELGLQSAGSLGSEEFHTALRNFWEATLIPGMRFIEGTLTKFFQKELGDNTFFKFDISNVDALKDDMKKKAEIATQMLQSGLSINEVRRNVWKEEASEDANADKPYVLVLSQPQFPAFSNPPPAQAETEELEALPPPEEEVEDKAILSPQMEQVRGLIQKQFADEESRTVSAMAGNIIKTLVEMTGVAMDIVLESNKAMPLYSMKDLPDDKVLKRRIEKALAGKFEEEWANETARTLSSSVDLGYGQMLEMVFNKEARREVEVLRARDSNKRRASLSARGLDSFAHVSKTHTDRIMSVVADSVGKGEAIGKTMRRVADALGTPGQLAGKAESIARTETLTAVSIGQNAAMKNAAEVMPGLKKGWMTAGDGRVRDQHIPLNGVVVDSSKNFPNGLAYPRDTNATDPAEVIQCRCSLILIPPGEDLEIPKP